MKNGYQPKIYVAPTDTPKYGTMLFKRKETPMITRENVDMICEIDDGIKDVNVEFNNLDYNNIFNKAYSLASTPTKDAIISPLEYGRWIAILYSEAEDKEKIMNKSKNIIDSEILSRETTQFFRNKMMEDYNGR